MNAPQILGQAVETGLLTLAKVHELRMGFIVPIYQRPYVWSDTDVCRLFSDIKDAYIRRQPHYFIGSVLTSVRGGQYYELIDGQQRTTTLMLMALAFKSNRMLTRLADVAVLGEMPRLTFEIRDSVQNLLGSYAGLEKMTRPGQDALRNDPYLTHLSANLEVLVQQVQTLGTDTAFDLHAFAEYIYSSVTWVNNVVPPRLDLNRLFFSMNTAGIQLEPVDLLKAKLLKRVTSEKALYSSIWVACEHTDNFFERNLRRVFRAADWEALRYSDLKSFDATRFWVPTDARAERSRGKTLSELLEEVNAGDIPANIDQKMWDEGGTEISDGTVYCSSIVGFDLLLIHALRIFCARQGRTDLEPPIKAGNLTACFEPLLQEGEDVIKAFFRLLWEVRYQFDTWVVKWIEHDDQKKSSQLRLTSVSASRSDNTVYLNRSAKPLSELVQLQAVRNFTGDRSAHHWLTAFIGLLVAYPDLKEAEVLAALENIDNVLSLTTDTQKEASFKIASGHRLKTPSWKEQAEYFERSRGTAFEHYWFQKLEYLLWKRGARDTDEKLAKYRITSKNSVEHVHPRKEEFGNTLAKEYLNAFGNLVLLSPGENSSYSNQAFIKKIADFQSKPHYDSLKLKELFACHADGRVKDTQRTGQHPDGLFEITEGSESYMINLIRQHQKEMLDVLAWHYEGGASNPQSIQGDTECPQPH